MGHVKYQVCHEKGYGEIEIENLYVKVFDSDCTLDRKRSFNKCKRIDIKQSVFSEHDGIKPENQ